MLSHKIAWSSDNNWLVPPTTLIGRVLWHMRNCKAVGTLIVPMWKSAQFWSLLGSNGVHLNSFVKTACFFRTDRISLLRVGQRIPCLAPRHLLSLDVLQFGLTSLTIVVFSLWVFVPLPKGGVLYVDLRRFAQVCLMRFSIDLLHYWLLFSIMNKKTILLKSCLPPGGRQVIG